MDEMSSWGISGLYFDVREICLDRKKHHVKNPKRYTEFVKDLEIYANNSTNSNFRSFSQILKRVWY